MLLVHSIFASLEGEGVYIGIPTIFVRFQGCKIGCVSCDTKETWNPNSGKEMTIKEIVEEVQKYSNIKRISITGGNPLEQNKDELSNLIDYLDMFFYEINIELPGVNDKIFETHWYDTVYKSLDVKTPSTGKWEESKKCFVNIYDKGRRLNPVDQIKMVVANRDDLKATKEIANLLVDSFATTIPLILTPCWNTHEKEIDVKWIETVRDFVFSEPIFKRIDIRVICQQHKLLYGAEKRDV